jgi:hypothetical protein
MDMNGINVAILGARTTGGAARRASRVGPRDQTSDPLAIRSPTRWVWLLIRILIDGEADRSTANALQDAIGLTGLSRPHPPRQATREAPWDLFVTALQALLIENPPPAEDLVFFDRIARLGLGPEGGFDAARFSASDIARIEAGLAKARASVIGKRSGNVRDGWIYPRSNLGAFGQDDLFRAQVAVGGLAGWSW